MYGMTKRVTDVAAALMAGFVLLPIACVVAIAIRLESVGPVLFFSDRVGKDNKIFRMPKFRTMNVDTPAVATDKLQNPTSFLTKLGGFLRKTSLDEIPQLWSVLVGDMSLVGPRPALFNQTELIEMRTESGVHAIPPGITGWAQINGRDTISLEEKVSLDNQYLQYRSLRFDLKVLWLTFLTVLKRESISH